MGIHEVEYSFPKKGRCFLCGEDILPKVHCRAKYVYHTKRFHAYIHVDEMHVLEKQFLPGGLRVFQEAEEAPPNMQTQIDSAVRAALERL